MQYENITREYMKAWEDFGFDLHVCNGVENVDTCLDAPVSEPESVVAFGADSIINIMIQRPAFSGRIKDPQPASSSQPAGALQPGTSPQPAGGAAPATSPQPGVPILAPDDIAPRVDSICTGVYLRHL